MTCADLLDPREHGGERDEARAADLRHERGERRLAGARRPPEDHRVQLAALERRAQHLARARAGAPGRRPRRAMRGRMRSASGPRLAAGSRARSVGSRTDPRSPPGGLLASVRRSGRATRAAPTRSSRWRRGVTFQRSRSARFGTVGDERHARRRRGEPVDPGVADDERAGRGRLRAEVLGDHAPAVRVRLERAASRRASPRGRSAAPARSGRAPTAVTSRALFVHSGRAEAGRARAGDRLERAGLERGVAQRRAARGRARSPRAPARGRAPAAGSGRSARRRGSDRPATGQRAAARARRSARMSSAIAARSSGRVGRGCDRGRTRTGARRAQHTVLG